MSSTLEADDIGGIWTGPRGRVTISNLTIMAIASFDGLAVIAALPSIAEDLGEVALLPWVATAYLGASAIAAIIAGPVIDAIGVRRTFRATGLWFLVTSALVAIAPSIELLLVARTLQGLGGGLVIAVVLASVGLAYPHSLRPRAFAANGAVWGVMGFGGPAIAALLLAFQGWRLIFIVQLPLTAIALATGWNALPSTRDRPTKIRTDFVGVAYLTAAVLFILVGLGQLGVRGWLAGVSGAVAIAALTLYWRHTGRTANPVMSRDHISRHPLGWVNLTVGLILAAGLAADNYLPLYVQVTHERSASFAAFSVMFLTIGWTAGSFIYARLLNHRPEVDSIILGASTMVPSLVVAGFAVAFEAPLTVIFGAFFFTGISIGFVSTASLTLIQHSSDTSEMGRVNAAHQFARTLSITMGVALGGAVLLLVVDQRIGDVEIVRSVLSGEAGSTGPATRDAVQAGLVWVIVAASGLGVACLAAATRLRKRINTRR